MFKNILVPTDGSDLSIVAAAQAVKLAKATGARISAFHSAEPYRLKMQDDDGSSLRDYVPPEQHAAEVAKQAHAYLDVIKDLASAAGVECSGHYVTHEFPAQAIIQAAGEYGCDGIVMGSHGRSGLKRLLLGSDTQKVLASTDLPVLVVR